MNFSKTRKTLGSIIPYKGIRKIIGDKMRSSLDTAAQANHRIKVDMTELVKYKDSLKAEGKAITITDMLVNITSCAIFENPIINSTLTDENIIIQDSINIGIAVAVENGLVVPCLKGVQDMGLGEISMKVKELVDRARNKKLMPDDMYGGTFTITNLGMFGIEGFTAIINPPESAILAVGAINKVPVVENYDHIVIKPVMEMSLTYDHRIIDGAPAAVFLQTLKKYIEKPNLMFGGTKENDC